MVVVQTPAAHEMIAGHLAQMRHDQRIHVDVSVRFVRLPATFESRASSENSTVARIEQALSSPGGAALIGRGGVICINGQRNFLLSTFVTPIPAAQDSPERAMLRGTVVEARPTVGEDDTTVTLELSIAHYADGEPVEWRAEDTVRCKDGESLLLSGKPGCDPRIVALMTAKIEHMDAVGD